jgi:hypothetical protein
VENCTLFHLSCSAKNVPEVRKVMRKLRSVIGYFDRSTQANNKLIKFQTNCDIEDYKDQPPKKMIQDVVTRWWSTFAAIDRAIYLKKAINGLCATGEVDCEKISDNEWKMLEQMQTVLHPMAFFQRVLEGKSYVTGSMVPSAAFHIRRMLKASFDDAHKSDGVRALSKVLLDDLDSRFLPNAIDSTKFTFSWGACIGFCKRYTTVHHYFFVAAFLDPRVKTKLSSDMVPADYNLLKDKILELMIAEAGGHSLSSSSSSSSSSPLLLLSSKGKKSNAEDKKSSKKAATIAKMYDDDDDFTDKIELTPDDSDPLSIIQCKCWAELTGFMHGSVKIPLNTDDDGYTNPLHWWTTNAKSYPVLACLANTYLAIPATSAPSERIFSRAGRILSMKRATLSPDIAQRMIMISENTCVLKHHYNVIAQEEKRDTSFINEEKRLLPCDTGGTTSILKDTDEDCMIVTDHDK